MVLPSTDPNNHFQDIKSFLPLAKNEWLQVKSKFCQIILLHTEPNTFCYRVSIEKSMAACLGQKHAMMFITCSLGWFIINHCVCVFWMPRNLKSAFNRQMKFRSSVSPNPNLLEKVLLFKMYNNTAQNFILASFFQKYPLHFRDKQSLRWIRSRHNDLFSCQRPGMQYTTYRDRRCNIFESCQ